MIDVPAEIWNGYEMRMLLPDDQELLAKSEDDLQYSVQNSIRSFHGDKCGEN
jgi:hypothetical protein